MKTSTEKRRIIVRGLLAAAMVPLVEAFFRLPAAADAAALDPTDPTAKALGYVTASTKPGSICGNCMQFKGNPGDPMGPCAIFPGKQVASAGWCLSWGKKTG